MSSRGSRVLYLTSEISENFGSLDLVWTHIKSESALSVKLSLSFILFLLDLCGI
jgi:hypothetical protein